MPLRGIPVYTTFVHKYMTLLIFSKTFNTRLIQNIYYKYKILSQTTLNDKTITKNK